jgi:deoxyribonuclease V
MAWARFYQHSIPDDLQGEVEAAIALQNKLRERVILRDDFGTITTIAGIDSGYDMERGLNKAVVALFDAATMELMTSVVAVAPTNFPYVPGLLSFREIPAVLKALSCLPKAPDLLMVDGQGTAHPRRLGIAAHLGVVTGLPATGIAKKKLCGKYEEPAPQKGAVSDLTDKGELIGYAYRSKDKCNPLFVSAGHRISHETALAFTRRSITTYRLPEPTRIADHISKWPVA